MDICLYSCKTNFRQCVFFMGKKNKKYCSLIFSQSITVYFAGYRLSFQTFPTTTVINNRHGVNATDFPMHQGTDGENKSLDELTIIWVFSNSSFFEIANDFYLVLDMSFVRFIDVTILQ